MKYLKNLFSNNFIFYYDLYTSNYGYEIDTSGSGYEKMDRYTLLKYQMILIGHWNTDIIIYFQHYWTERE